MLSHLIEILSRPSQLYFVAKQEKGYERGASVPIQMESWFNGQCTSRFSYFSMIICPVIQRVEQENYHQLWFRQILHDGWKPISCLLPCWCFRKKKYFLLLFCLFVHFGRFPWHFALFLYFTQGSKTHLWKKIFSFPQLQSVGNWPLKSLIHFKIVCQTFLVAISVGKIQYLDKSSTIPFAACALQRKRDTLGYSENSRLLPPKTSLLLSSDEF